MTSASNPSPADFASDWLVAHGADVYREMLRIRRFEERTRDLRLADHIAGSVHLCIGQESTPVVTAMCLSPDDRVLSTYRGHGWVLAMGTDMSKLFAELMGRSAGTNGGRGGSALLSDPSVGFLGENSIVGAGAPIACGVALAAQLLERESVTVTVIGDGAMNQGSVTEAMNAAAAFQLPIVFVCENNSWSELTPIESMVGDTRLHRRGEPLGLRSLRVDGNDLPALHRSLDDVVQECRESSTPFLVEVMTQRLVGHYIGDLDNYRREGEVEANDANEALGRLERSLLASGVPEVELAATAENIDDEIEAAVATALASAPAASDSATDHVYEH